MSKPSPDRFFMRFGWLLSFERRSPDDVEYVRVGEFTEEDVELLEEAASNEENVIFESGSSEDMRRAEEYKRPYFDLAQRIKAQLPEKTP